MKKQSTKETLLYLLTGLIFPIAYYFVMTLLFKVNPFEGYYRIPTIYIIVCYFLFPISGSKFTEANYDKKPYRWFTARFNMTISYILAPFILIKYRNK